MGGSDSIGCQRGVICVVVCVVTLPSLPVSGYVAECRSMTSKRQRAATKAA